MREIEGLREFFEETTATPRFSRRAVSIPGDFRTAWRLSILCLLLQRGRANTLTLEHLHVLWWSIRTAKSRELLLRWFEGDRSPDELLVRFDPSLTVTVDLALGQGLVSLESNRSVRLANAGASLAKSIHEQEDLMIIEKTFLAALPAKITQRQVRELLEWK
ncbi:hypothetical protein [Kocuria carniphila]|uniref:hypothetical protein n=1 Tax=Kocuria carniphila TaxID=262208 RepID=UPI00101CFD76|nr:hypothetical protein [Kocuria carniphila]